MKPFSVLIILMTSMSWIFARPLHADSAFHYLESAVYSLDSAQEARDVFYQGLLKYSEKRRENELTRALYKAMKKIKRAQLDINRYGQTSDLLTQKSVDLFNRSFQYMEYNFEVIDQLIQETQDSQQLQVEVDFEAHLKRRASSLNRIGKDLHNAMVLAIYSSLDDAKKGKFNEWTHIKMSRQEFRKLNQMMESRFTGDRTIYFDRDKQPVKAAMLVLWQFLDGDWKTRGELVETSTANKFELFNQDQLNILNQPQ